MALAASLGGLILGVRPTPGMAHTTVEPLENFAVVGWLAAGAALVSSWMVRHLQTVEAIALELPTSPLAETHVETDVQESVSGLALAVPTEPMVPPS